MKLKSNLHLAIATCVMGGFLSSCATHNLNRNLDTAATANTTAEKPVAKTNDRIQTHLIDETLPLCNDCIIGSIGDEELKSETEKKVYFLYGAEHLELSNYYFDTKD